VRGFVAYLQPRVCLAPSFAADPAPLRTDRATPYLDSVEDFAATMTAAAAAHIAGGGDLQTAHPLPTMPACASCEAINPRAAPASTWR
jgi:hypothetical protein